MQSDPIGDMLTSIRNGMAARHHKVDIPGSRVKIELARILKQACRSPAVAYTWIRRTYRESLVAWGCAS